ncbi:hypothetical protein BDZ45DRAFT_678233 [Acephala macrosclerotiorum]|nr:hypothetical protein BDZ45DRAFT_678233 [Acephala macrosclerotiorum]
MISRTTQRVFPYPGPVAVASRADLTSPECDCIDCLRRRAYDQLHYQCFRDPHSHLGCDNSCDAKHKDNFPFKTKDVTIRGKAFSFRASYLVEVPKLEKEFVSFMEKKSQEEVPDRVVNMLVSFVNLENYRNDDPLDEITLNILASNVGAKSVVEHSMDQVKKLEKNVNLDNIVDIICTVMESSGVIDRLTDWLKDILCQDGCRHEKFIEDVMDLAEYLKKIYKPNPNLHLKLSVMTGLQEKPETPKTRVISY